MHRSGRPEPGAIRTSLADAAWRLFADSPPAGVSTRDIAEASGCSHAMVTRAFGGKAGLELAVSERLAQVLEVAVISAFTEHDQPFSALIEVWRSHPRVAHLLVRAGLNDLPVQPLVDSVSLGHRLVGHIEELRGGNPKRPAQRSRVAAYLTLCGLFGLYTFDEFLTWATRLDGMPVADRDRVSALALQSVAALAADSSIDLRLPRAGRSGAPGGARSTRGRASGRREVRQALVLAAAELFASKGPAAVSIREISERAGLQHGLIHRYFGSKDALLEAALDGIFDPMVTAATVGASLDVPTVVRLQLDSLGTWLFARLLVDGVDIRSVRPTNPIFAAVLSRYPQLPDGAGPVSLDNPRLALHAAAAVTMGATIWDKPVRQLCGLPVEDDVAIDVPISTAVMYLLSNLA